jgi:hypothetical protein
MSRHLRDSLMVSIGHGKEEYNKERLYPKLWILIPFEVGFDFFRVEVELLFSDLGVFIWVRDKRFSR